MSVPIGQMVFSDYFRTAAEERYSSESSRDFKVFIEVQAEVQ